MGRAARSRVTASALHVLVAGLAVLVAGLAVGGCGDDGAADAPPTSTTSTTEKVKDPEKRSFGETIEVEGLLPEDDEAREAAEDLRARSVAAVSSHRWDDLAAASAEGFVPMFGEEAHWVNRANVLDGVSWDVDHPEFLVVDDGKLLGLMFAAPDPGLDQPPPPGSPLVRWHYHRWGNPVCLEQGIIAVARADAAGMCPAGSEPRHESSLMAHVWTIDDDGDPFATDMQAHQH